MTDTELQASIDKAIEDGDQHLLAELQYRKEMRQGLAPSRREHEHEAFLYDGRTGEHLRNVANSYKWCLKYKDVIADVSISELPDGGAYVDVRIVDYLLMRERWGSFKLAYQRYNRWSKMWGFNLSHHMYFVLAPGA